MTTLPYAENKAPNAGEPENRTLTKILATLQDGGTPAHDYIAITYHGSTNNIATVAYKVGGSGGTTVATLTLAYVGGVPTADNAKLISVTQS